MPHRQITIARAWVRVAVATLGLLAVSAHAQAAAQPFPQRPVRIVVPFPAGGLTDTFARALATDLQAGWGQPVVVENRPGAAGAIGTDMVAKAPADGHVLALVISTHVVNGLLMKSATLDPVADFTPLALLARSPHLLVAAAGTRLPDLAALAALAKAQPPALSFAVTTTRLPVEQLQRALQGRFVQVPYRGAAQALQDVAAGTTDLMFVTPSTGLAQLGSGRLRALAVTGAARLPAAPQVPSMRDLGVAFDYDEWWGLVGPARLPREVAQRIERSVLEVAARWREAGRFRDLGITLDPQPGARFAEFMARERDQWAAVAKSAGIEKE